VRGVSVLVFLALAGSATAAVLAGGEAGGARASAISAGGSFSFANSRDGMPIFSATGIAPGDSASGTVEIANNGGEPGELVLSQHDATDAVGPGGARLSERLTMRVTDVTVPAHPLTVYAGPLAPMPARPAGQVAAGATRTYEFVATLPESAGSGTQNDVQGASASVAYVWTAGEVTAAPVGPTPPLAPAPGQTPPNIVPGSVQSAGAAPAPLHLKITRVRPTVRRGRLLVLARCDQTCTISGRGQLRARGSGGHRVARLHLRRRPRHVAGTQHLKIRLPGPIRRWLRAHPERLRAKVRIVLVARTPEGLTAKAQRAVRLARSR